MDQKRGGRSDLLDSLPLASRLILSTPTPSIPSFPPTTSPYRPSSLGLGVTSLFFRPPCTILYPQMADRDILAAGPRTNSFAVKVDNFNDAVARSVVGRWFRLDGCGHPLQRQGSKFVSSMVLPFLVILRLSFADLWILTPSSTFDDRRPSFVLAS